MRRMSLKVILHKHLALNTVVKILPILISNHFQSHFFPALPPGNSFDFITYHLKSLVKSGEEAKYWISFLIQICIYFLPTETAWAFKIAAVFLCYFLLWQPTDFGVWPSDTVKRCLIPLRDAPKKIPRQGLNKHWDEKKEGENRSATKGEMTDEWHEMLHSDRHRDCRCWLFEGHFKRRHPSEGGARIQQPFSPCARCRFATTRGLNRRSTYQ